MYSDEGPSTRPFLSMRRSPSVDLEALQLSSQEEDNEPQETADPERVHLTAPSPLKSEFCPLRVASILKTQLRREKLS